MPVQRKRSISELVSVRVAQTLVDILIFAAALQAAYMIRFEGNIPPQFYRQMIVCLPYLALLRFATNAFFGVYRIVWRYVGVRETLRFAQAVGAVSALLVVIRMLYSGRIPYFRIPVSIIIMEGTFVFIGMTAARFIRRIQHERRDRNGRRDPERISVVTLLVGAGESGLALAKEAVRSPESGIQVLGFLDDDKTKAGMEVNGARVIGTLADLPRTLEIHNVQQVIITTSRIPPAAIMDIMNRCRTLNVRVRIAPTLSEILGSNLQVRMLRDVRIEDLLARDPIAPSLSPDDLRNVYRGKRILVTGAGGSIGSELSRQLLLMEPESLILLERDENNLFEIDRKLEAADIRGVRHAVLADVTDEATLDNVFHQFRPTSIFHAAAYKHVPMMEAFPAFAAQNNVIGTNNLVERCKKYGVDSFVMISTDKAVNPTSVMGATKRLAELLVQRAAAEQGTRFSCVRFGNVLGSRGSVVGIFREQIRKGGPVTVTHEGATRYFMTVQEAVNLVLQASTLGETGEVFLLDMGRPVKIIDLARQMIQLSGFSEAQVPINVVGMRPGEKMFEELSVDAEHIAPTSLRKVFRCAPVSPDDGVLDRTLTRLEHLVAARDHERVRDVLSDLQIGYAFTTHDVVEPKLVALTGPATAPQSDSAHSS